MTRMVALFMMRAVLDDLTAFISFRSTMTLVLIGVNSNVGFAKPAQYEHVEVELTYCCKQLKYGIGI